MRASGWHQFMVIFKRDLINIVLNPVLLLYNTVFPLLLTLVLGYLAAGSYGGGGISSYDYYGVTLLIYSVLNVSMTASNSFMERSLKASNLRILYAPFRLSFVYLGKIAATFVFTATCFLALIGMLYLTLGVNFGGDYFGYVLVILLLFNLLAAATGVLFCCIFHSEEITNKILSPVISLLALLGGLFFPLDGLGRAAERVSWLSPVKWVVEAIFRLIYDQDASLFLPVVLVLAGLTVAALAGCKLTFRTEDYVLASFWQLSP